MEKQKKRYLSIGFIIVLITSILIAAIDDIFTSLLILAFVYVIVDAGIYIRKGFYNIKNCDDELFKNIDQYKKYLREGNQYYTKQIEIINFYYKEDGKVDELVKKREIERLYARADFLLMKKSVFENVINMFQSFIISVIVSYVFKVMEYESVLVVGALVGTLLLVFIELVMSRYAERGQAGSYLYYVNTYERELLLKKINKLEEELIINDDDEQVLETKQAVINELIRIKNKKKLKKHKERLKADLKRVGELNLYIEDYGKSYKRKIYINGADAYLLYDLEKGKENNYIGELNLINKEYSMLYQILSRYELISYSTDR